MTSILYWNIENFSTNKISNPRPKRKRGSSVTEADAADARRDYIMRHIDDLDPDIFIIVEVETPWNNNRGVLCGGGGEIGVNELFNLLYRADNTWAMVPALITGNKESVAVYFHDDRVQFSGPKLWAGGNGPTNNGVTALTARAYPAGWRTLSNAAVDANSAFNPNVAQSKCAAAVTFNRTNGTAIDFGQNTRTPFQTTFWDVAGQRNINIFTVHSPADWFWADAFVNDMAVASEIRRNLRNNEVRLVLGDFNLNLLRVTDNTYIDPYAALITRGYSVALAPPIAVPNPLLGYRGFFATHIRPVDSAEFWSTANNSVYYPTYAYSGDSTNPGRNESIDNVLYRGNDPNPLVPRLTIINGIVGSPFRNTNPPRPSVGTPVGTQAFNAEIDWTWLGANAPNQGPLTTTIAWPGSQTWFESFPVYGKIRSTSDHLPLFFEI